MTATTLTGQQLAEIRARFEATTNPGWRDSTDVGILLAELDRLRAELEQARQLTADRITDGLTAIHDDPDTADKYRPGLRKALRSIHRLATRPSA